MSDVGAYAFWIVVGCWWAWRAYRKREVERQRAFRAWLEKPLPPVPAATDWRAFERRVEAELDDEVTRAWAHLAP